MSLLDSSTTVLPILGVGLFAGAQVCIHASAFPAMASLDDANAVRFFGIFYPPLKLIQPALLIVAAIASVLHLTVGSVPSSLAYAVHVLVVVHTVFVLGWTATLMLADNDKLVAAANHKWQESRKGEIRTMLQNWGVRNEARVWPSLVLFVLLVVVETGKH